MPDKVVPPPPEMTVAAKNLAAKLKTTGRVRMIDVARAVGVSRPTVSYVLNGCQRGKTRVKPETAERIREVARQLNFHPNHAARQLTGKRSGVVAVLADNFFNQPLLRALSWLNHLGSERGLEILGWEAASKTLTIEDHVGKCLGWNVDGLIFVTLDGNPLKPEEAKALGRLPRVVSLFDDFGIPGGYCIDYDSGEGARQAVQYLHAQGRRKIVQVLEDLDTPMNRRRYEGFLASHRELGRPLADDHVCLATHGWDRDDYAKFAALLDELIDRHHADAILADNDGTAAFLRRPSGAAASTCQTTWPSSAGATKLCLHG